MLLKFEDLVFCSSCRLQALCGDISHYFIIKTLSRHWQYNFSLVHVRLTSLVKSLLLNPTQIHQNPINYGHVWQDCIIEMDVFCAIISSELFSCVLCIFSMTLPNISLLNILCTKTRDCWQCYHILSFIQDNELPAVLYNCKDVASYCLQITPCLCAVFLQVTINDGGVPIPLTSTVQVIVTITDDNDNSPTFETRGLIRVPLLRLVCGRLSVQQPILR